MLSTQTIEATFMLLNNFSMLTRTRVYEFRTFIYKVTLLTKNANWIRRGGCNSAYEFELVT